MTNHGPDTSDNHVDLLELGLDEAPAKTVKIAAPAITAPAPAPLSPLAQGCALVAKCVDVPELQALAKVLNTPATAGGAWFKALPTGTQDAIRLAWRDRRDAFVFAERINLLIETWAPLWASLATGLAARPHVWADGLPHSVPAEAPAAQSVQAGTSGVVDSGSTFTQLLADAGEQSAANAAGATIGSMAGGQMAGVGWYNAQGYVTALANGTKEPTTSQYLSVLRSRFGFSEEQIAALTIGTIQQSDLPVGPGIVVDSTGGLTARQVREAWKNDSPAVKARKEREAAEKAAKLAKEKQQAEQDAENKRIVIAGLVATRDGLIVSPGEAWDGFTVPAAEFRALIPAEFAHLQIGVKTDRALFGKIMGSMKSRGLHSVHVKKSTTEAWPSDVVSRWGVWRLDTSTNLATPGDKELIAELVRVVVNDKPTYEVRFYGGSAELRDRVLSAFTERKAEAALDVGDLNNWLKKRVLRDEFNAVKWGGFWFVPGTAEQTRGVETLIAAVAESIGRQVSIGQTTTNEKWSRGIAENLMIEVKRVAKDVEKARRTAEARAVEKAIKDGVDDAGQQIAARQAQLSDEVARNRLKDLLKLSTLVDGYVALLGEEQHAKVTGEIAKLRTYCERFLDDTTVMMANLELDLDDNDEAESTEEGEEHEPWLGDAAAAPTTASDDSDDESLLELD